MIKKINWIYQGEAGYWVSSEGRFSIDPGGFRHGVTPDFYELRDEFAVFRARIKNPTGNLTGISSNFETVAGAKSAAVFITSKEQ